MHHALTSYHGNGRLPARRGLEMSRLIWVALGVLLGVAGSMAAFILSTRLGLEDSVAANTIFSAVVALLAFYIASFCVPGFLAAAQMAQSNRRLPSVVQAGRQDPIDP